MCLLDISKFRKNIEISVLAFHLNEYKVRDGGLSPSWGLAQGNFICACQPWNLPEILRSKSTSVTVTVGLDNGGFWWWQWGFFGCSLVGFVFCFFFHVMELHGFIFDRITLQWCLQKRQYKVSTQEQQTVHPEKMGFVSENSIQSSSDRQLGASGWLKPGLLLRSCVQQQRRGIEMGIRREL